MTEAEQGPAARTQATAETGGHGETSRGRRVVNILAAVVVALVLPMLLLGLVIGEFAAAAMFAGLLFGVVGSKIGGTRRMLDVAPALGVAGGLGAVTAYDGWWVALLAASGVVSGAGFRFGWFPTLLMLPYAATFVTPLSSATDAWIYGMVLAIATAYGIVIARRFGAVPAVGGERMAWPVSLVVAIVFGAVMGVSAAIGVALGWTEPYWVPEPVLILALYIVMGRRERIREKSIGTALGVAASIPVAILAPSAWVLAVLVTLAFVLAFMEAKRYWLMYGLYTFALVLSLAGPGQVATEAKHRGIEILVGIGLLVIGLAIIHFLANWLAARDPQPDLAPAT